MAGKKKAEKSTNDKLVEKTTAQVQKLADKAQKETDKLLESYRKLVKKAETRYQEILGQVSDKMKTGDTKALKLLKDAQAHAEAALEAAKKDYEKAKAMFQQSAFFALENCEAPPLCVAYLLQRDSHWTIEAHGGEV